MYLIIYTSQFTGVTDDINSVLSDIVTVAKIKNPLDNITGVLFFHNGRFLQILEGEAVALEKLMQILARDPRHQQIQRIVDEPILERGFSAWNMDFFNLSDEDVLDPDELFHIFQAYKTILVVESKILTNFYKAMLKTHALRAHLS